MQTFLPYIGEYDDSLQLYEECAGLLDQKRLGKQRVENLQIMRSLFIGKGWVNHPAVKMWRGHEWSLLKYQYAICQEWAIECGFKDTCLAKSIRLYFEHFDPDARADHSDPPWLGDPELHLSHQSNLIRKDPEYYSKRFPGVPDDLPYIWPVQ